MPDGGSGHADTIDSAACPLAARAQQADRMRRIAVVMGVAEAARVGCEIVKVYKEHASAAPRAATSAGVRQAMS
jgi:hypothetical protein